MLRPLVFSKAHVKRYVESKFQHKVPGWAENVDERLNYLRGFKTLTELGGFGREADDTNVFAYIKLPMLRFQKHEMGHYNSAEDWLKELRKRAESFRSATGYREAAIELINKIDEWLKNPTR